MSTDDSNSQNSVSLDTDLDAFSEEFFQTKSVETLNEQAPEPVKEEDANEEQTIEDDTLATEENESASEEHEEEESDESSAPKKKKKTFQERIDEIVGKQKAAERSQLETQRRLEAALAELENFKNSNTPKETAVYTQEPATGPDPNAEKPDGTRKYELGEFDPEYIKDLTKYTLEQQVKQFQQQQAQELAQKAADEKEAALQAKWNSKLAESQTKYPDFHEKGQEFIDTFQGLDQNYSKYLTNTLMEMEFGLDVFYYLANNKDEAIKVINSGPVGATIALGRIESKFIEEAAKKVLARPKISQAPAPPPRINKGSTVTAPTVSPDTDDLEAFSKEFFKKGPRY